MAASVDGKKIKIILMLFCTLDSASVYIYCSQTAPRHTGVTVNSRGCCGIFYIFEGNSAMQDNCWTSCNLLIQDSL